MMEMVSGIKYWLKGFFMLGRLPYMIYEEHHHLKIVDKRLAILENDYRVLHLACLNEDKARDLNLKFFSEKDKKLREELTILRMEEAELRAKEKQ